MKNNCVIFFGLGWRRPCLITRKFAAKASDRKRVRVDEGVTYNWRVTEGTGTLTESAGEFLEFTAPSEPGVVRITLTATQGQISVDAEAVVTVTE